MNKPDVIYIEDDDNYFSSSATEDLKVLSLNIRSLVNKLSLFELFLDSLNTNESKIDVILLSETWIEDGNHAFYELDGYNAFHFTRQNRGGGGLVFYIREGIKVDHNIQKISLREVQLLIIHLSELKITLCGVYRPPTSVNSNMVEFLEGYDEILENHKNMISLGDFNIDLLNDKNNLDLINLLNSNSFSILNKISSESFTRSDVKSRSIIDHVHTNLDQQFVVQLGESGLSDHKYILAIVKTSGSSEKETTISDLLLTIRKPPFYLKINYLKTRLQRLMNFTSILELPFPKPQKSS